MKNIEVDKDGNFLKLKIDLSKGYGESKSGKSIVVASSEGFEGVGNGVSFNLNVIKKR